MQLLYILWQNCKVTVIFFLVISDKMYLSTIINLLNSIGLNLQQDVLSSHLFVTLSAIAHLLVIV